MGAGKSGPHLEEAVLSAYAVRQVDPARRAAFSKHLEGCPDCRERLARVKALTEMLVSAPRRELDELAWRRLRDRVKAQLEDEARDLPRTQDLRVTRWWAAAGLGATVAVALAVWLVPRAPKPVVAPGGSLLPPEVRAPVRHAAGHRPLLATGSAPLRATLATGLELRLSPNSRVESLGAVGEEEVLVLRVGEVEVRTGFDATPAPPVVRVHTDRFMVRGPGRVFRVGLWADRFLVAVEEGHVTVRGEPFARGETVGPGEERRGRFAGSGAREEALSPHRAERAPPKVGGARASREDAPGFADRPLSRSGVEVTGAQGETQPGEGLVAGRERARAPPSPRVDQVRTEVEVVKTPSDSVAYALRRAQVAYYQTRDLDEAARWAVRAVRAGAVRPEAAPAHRLLCDIYIAGQRPQDAVRACRAALDVAPREARRALHYTLATVFRTQLEDCRSAIEHYNRVSVFGARTVLDDDVRLFRAACALSLGDREQAERDIRALEERSGWLARPEELERLKRQLRDGAPLSESIKNAE